MSKSRKKSTGRLRSLDSLLALSEQATQQGQSKKAMQYLREAIEQKPRDGRPYFFLGKLYRQANQPEKALACYDQALKIDPDNLAVQLNRANVLQILGRLDLAKAAYQNVLSQQPGVAVGHFNLGVVMRQLGDQAGAMAEFRTAAQLQPELAAAHYQLAKTLAELDQAQDAIDAYQRVVSLEPQNVAAQRELAVLLDTVGAPAGAEAAYLAALAIEPNDSETLYSLGTVQQQQEKYDEAIASYQRSAEIQPRQVRALAGLGNTLHQIGEVEQAAQQYKAALKIDPSFAHARIGAVMSQLPIIYESEADIQESRERYRQALNDLHEHYTAAGQQERAAAAAAIGFLQPFYLSYQGLPVCDLQKQYGELLVMLMEARYPEFSSSPEMPPGSEKIRLGVASGFLRNHSSWNIFQGLIEAIDRERFEVFMFHTRIQQDRETELLRRICDGFIQGPLSIAQWATTIRDHHLHVLFFPEFGMDPVSVQLGSLRLAPIQMASWGHPVTSGLPTIDHYLSSDLMEPENAQDDYSEQLLRLPNSSMHYRLPVVDPEPMQRDDLDVPDGSVVYWCCQSLFKYLPRHDDVFPRIAREVREAVFLFISQSGGIVEQKFKKRMSAAFAREGLDMETHCRFLPSLPKPVFAAMTALSDIFLDSIGWSGCNSAMEAIAADRPILTLPGDFMRGRHCKSFLEIMGLDEWIANDKDEFLSMAVRLGRDESLRKHLSDQVRDRKSRLYRDSEPVRALESFLEKAVESRKSAAHRAITERLQDSPEQVPTEVLDSPAGTSMNFWQEGIRLQGEGQFEKAAKTLQRSLMLSNPAYAAAYGPPSQLMQPAASEQGEIELNGLHYPAIVPVSGTEPRPFWSVVIPVFNRDKFLLECLASVLAQWTGDEAMEIIVIDNGSEPALESMVRSIGKGIVKYHRHTETLPLQVNWNSAVRACRGQWVHLLHDDDYVLPGFYQALREGLENSPDSVGAAFTAYENINENREIIFRNRVFGTQRGIAQGWINRIGVCNVLNPPAVVIKRDAYEKLGGYSEEILYTTDWELYLRLVSFYDWWYEPEILVHYRQHTLNVTTEQNRAGAQGEAFWRAIGMAERYLPLEHRERMTSKSRRYYFNWCLERLRLPLLAGNPGGALKLLQQMLRIDQTDQSLADLFDWLGTTFAAPLWPEISKIYDALPPEHQQRTFNQSAELFDWLRFDCASELRRVLADALIQKLPN